MSSKAALLAIVLATVLGVDDNSLFAEVIQQFADTFRHQANTLRTRDVQLAFAGARAPQNL
jgi:hypothetical protein